MVFNERRQFPDEQLRRKRNPVFDDAGEPDSAAQQAWKQMAEAREALVRHAGPIGLELARADNALDLNDEQMPEALEGLMDFQEFQEAGIEFLEQLGVVEREMGFTIVDLDKLDEINSPLLREGTRRKETTVSGKRTSVKVGRISEEADESRKKLKGDFFDYWSENAADFLFDVFYNQKVVSKEDWEDYQKNGGGNEAPEPKDLFYNPRSEEEAFNVDSIKKADFYLGLWQLHGRRSRNDCYSRFHRDLSAMEVSLACAIYHPNYGDGERDEDGDLEVTHSAPKKTGSGNPRRQRRSMSIDWMVRNAPFKNLSSAAPPEVRRVYLRTPEVLQEGAFPHLTESRNGKPPLLGPEDFAVLSTSEYAKKFGVVLSIIGTDRSAMVTIEHVRYNLGVEFSNQKYGFEKYAVYKISDSLAGVVERDQKTGAEKLVKTFFLVAPGDPRARKVETTHHSFYYAVGAKEMRIDDFAGEEEIFLQRRPDESENNFVERKKAFDFATMLELKQEIVRETGVSLQGLSPKEQQAFLEYYRSADEQDKQKLFQFVRIHRNNGLKTFLAAEYDGSAGDKILRLAEKTEPARAGVVFEKFNSLLVLADRVEDETREFFVDAGKAASVSQPRVVEEIMKRVVKLLENYADNHGKKGEKTLVELVMELDKVKEEILLFAAIFKTAFKGHGGMNLSEVRGLDLQSSDSGQLSQEDIASMRQIFHDNRAELSPQFAAFRVKEEFDPVMKEPGHKFYVLKKDGRIISFARFDELPNGNLYTGFVNTRPDIKGMAIGGAFFEAALAREAIGRGVELKVRTENPAQKLYARLGFKVIDRYVDQKSGKEYVRMLRPAVAELEAEEQRAEELRKAV